MFFSFSCILQIDAADWDQGAKVPENKERYSDFVKGPGKIMVFRVFLKIGGSSSFLQEVPPLATDGEHFWFYF